MMIPFNSYIIPDMELNDSHLLDDLVRPSVVDGDFECITMNDEIAILRNGNDKYAFYIDNTPRLEFKEYCELSYWFDEYENEVVNNEYFEVDERAITSYVNDKIKKKELTIGYTYDDWLDGQTFVKINDEIKNDIITTWKTIKIDGEI